MSVEDADATIRASAALRQQGFLFSSIRIPQALAPTKEFRTPLLQVGPVILNGGASFLKGSAAANSSKSLRSNLS